LPQFADLFSIFQAFSILLVAFILWFTVRAYRLTGQPYLINFFLAFTVLEASFGFVLLNRLFGQTGLLYHGTLWVHEILQVVAFGFLASTYFFKNRGLTIRSTSVLVYFLSLAAVIALAAYFMVQPASVFAWRITIAQYLYSINLVLLSYVLYNVLLTYKPASEKSNIIVPAGFGLLTVGQALWVYWGFTDQSVALLLANLFYVLGLAPLSAALLMIRRHKYAEIT
jgi:hypothetical protein